MKKTLLLMALLLTGVATQSVMAKPAKKQKQKKDVVASLVLQNDVDSAAYALGISLGRP